MKGFKASGFQFRVVFGSLFFLSAMRSRDCFGNSGKYQRGVLARLADKGAKQDVLGPA